MIRTTILLIAIFFYQTVFSQVDTSITVKNGFYFESARRFCNLNELNKDLKNAGYSELDNNYVGFSIGCASRFSDKNSYGTAQMTFLSIGPMNKDTNSKNGDIYTLELSTEMHCVISKSSKWFVYPYYGFGIDYSMLKLTETVNQMNFNQSISDLSSKEKNIKKYYMDMPLVFVNLGIGIDRKIRIHETNYYIGLGLGYRLSTKSRWGYNDSPSISYTGFEFKVRIRFEFENTWSRKNRPSIYKHIN